MARLKKQKLLFGLAIFFERKIIRKVKIEYVDIDRLKEWGNNPRINDEASKTVKINQILWFYKSDNYHSRWSDPNRAHQI